MSTILENIKRRNEEPEEDTTIVSTTVRMNQALFARIQALSEMSRMSRNSTMVELLYDAQAAVWEKLDEEERKAIEERTVELLKQFFEKGGVDK